ncbi:hypothetical protein D3C80_1333500 [compost metagenome]
MHGGAKTGHGFGCGRLPQQDAGGIAGQHGRREKHRERDDQQRQTCDEKPVHNEIEYECPQDRLPDFESFQSPA